MTYAESGLFWSQCFLPSLIIRKAQAGAGKSSLGLLWFCRKNAPGVPFIESSLKKCNGPNCNN